MESLRGKVALVTGSSRGIGSAIALALAAAGADICVNFVRRSADAEAVKSQVIGLSRNCIAVQADVSRPEDVQYLIRSTQESLGEISILINNAGVSRPQSIEE